MSVTDHRFDTGRLCLDLTATVGSALGDSPVERLESPDRLRQWLVGAGLLTTEQNIEVDAGWLALFRSLRTLIDRTVHDALAEHVRDADLDRINSFTRVAPPAIRIERDDHGFRAKLNTPVTAEAFASVISRDLISLLASQQRGLLHQCDREDCGLVYVDTSRGHRRRWCSGASCGNRERVARHRARTHT
ncbi:MAG: CGNR zinc finger domain-containing protein [Pseudonocardiaceae bacterium]